MEPAEGRANGQAGSRCEWCRLVSPGVQPMAMTDTVVAAGNLKMMEKMYARNGMANIWQASPTSGPLSSRTLRTNLANDTVAPKPSMSRPTSTAMMVWSVDPESAMLLAPGSQATSLWPRRRQANAGFGECLQSRSSEKR